MAHAMEANITGLDTKKEQVIDTEESQGRFYKVVPLGLSLEG